MERGLAKGLARENERRKAVEREILGEAVRAVEASGQGGESKRAVVVGGEAWHRGVIGIVASRLVDRYHRPAVVLSYEGGVAWEREAEEKSSTSRRVAFLPMSPPMSAQRRCASTRSAMTTGRLLQTNSSACSTG